MTERYQRGNQNPYIEEEQTTQWPKDTNGVIRIRISKRNRQHNGQKYKRKKNDPQNITHKTKDRVTRTPLKTGGEPTQFVYVQNNHLKRNSRFQRYI